MESLARIIWRTEGIQGVQFGKQAKLSSLWKDFVHRNFPIIDTHIWICITDTYTYGNKDPPLELINGITNITLYSMHLKSGCFYILKKAERKLETNPNLNVII